MIDLSTTYVPFTLLLVDCIEFTTAVYLTLDYGCVNLVTTGVIIDLTITLYY